MDYKLEFDRAMEALVSTIEMHKAQDELFSKQSKVIVRLCEEAVQLKALLKANGIQLPARVK